MKYSCDHHGKILCKEKKWRWIHNAAIEWDIIIRVLFLIPNSNGDHILSQNPMSKTIPTWASTTFEHVHCIYIHMYMYVFIVIITIVINTVHGGVAQSPSSV